MAAKAKLDAFLKQLDDQLSQVAILNKATEKVKVPFFKAYLVLGLGFLVVLLIAIGVADDFLTDLIGTAFPAFASLKLAYSFVRNSVARLCSSHLALLASFSILIGPRSPLVMPPPSSAARSLSG